MKVFSWFNRKEKPPIRDKSVSDLEWSKKYTTEGEYDGVCKAPEYTAPVRHTPPVRAREQLDYIPDREYDYLTKQRRKPKHRKQPRDIIRHKATSMLNGARTRAAKKGIACTISCEWIEDKLRNGRCEVTGMKFNLDPPSSKFNSNNRNAPSLDRIDSAFGYTPDNVQVVIWHYNAAKSEYTTKQFIQMARTAVKEYDKAQTAATSKKPSPKS